MASAAILMGGAARRLDGRDKGAIRVGGESIRDRQLRALAPITDDIMIVGGHLAETPAHTRSIADHHPGLGPLAGLESALAASRDDAVVVLACDLPFVTTELLMYLLSLAPTADAIVPRTDRGYHPLCAVYDRRCLEAVRQQLDRRDLAVRGLLATLRVRAIESAELTQFGPEARLLANVNTAADLNEIETLLNHEL